VQHDLVDLGGDAAGNLADHAAGLGADAASKAVARVGDQNVGIQAFGFFDGDELVFDSAAHGGTQGFGVVIAFEQFDRQPARRQRAGQADFSNFGQKRINRGFNGRRKIKRNTSVAGFMGDDGFF